MYLLTGKVSLKGYCVFPQTLIDSGTILQLRVICCLLVAEGI